MLGMIEGRRRRGQQRIRQLDSITDPDRNLSKLWEIVRTGKPGKLQYMGWQRVGHYWANEQQLTGRNGGSRWQCLAVRHSALNPTFLEI